MIESEDTTDRTDVLQSNSWYPTHLVISNLALALLQLAQQVETAWPSLLFMHGQSWPGGGQYFPTTLTRLGRDRAIIPTLKPNDSQCAEYAAYSVQHAVSSVNIVLCSLKVWCIKFSSLFPCGLPSPVSSCNSTISSEDSVNLQGQKARHQTRQEVGQEDQKAWVKVFICMEWHLIRDYQGSGLRHNESSTSLVQGSGAEAWIVSEIWQSIHEEILLALQCSAVLTAVVYYTVELFSSLYCSVVQGGQSKVFTMMQYSDEKWCAVICILTNYSEGWCGVV